MKWARILVANDGRNIPKEVSISRNVVPEKIEHMEKIEHRITRYMPLHNCLKVVKVVVKSVVKHVEKYNPSSLRILYQRNKWIQL